MAQVNSDIGNIKDLLDRKEQEMYLAQEQMIARELGLDGPDFDLNERIMVAKYITDLEQALGQETNLLFSPDHSELGPMELLPFIRKLINDCNDIAQMALSRAAVWCYDRIASFVQDMEKVAGYGDESFKQNFVVAVKIVGEAQARSDMVAVYDLFYGEIPALLRQLFHQISEQIVGLPGSAKI